VKEKGKITNSDYQEPNKVARITATRVLTDLVGKGLLKTSDTKGSGSYFYPL
jgi:predicted HTH transcriptional regulator